MSKENIKDALNVLINESKCCRECKFIDRCCELSRMHGIIPCELFEDLLEDIN